MTDKLMTLAQGLLGVNQPDPTDFQTPQDFKQADRWHGLGELASLAPALAAPMMAFKAFHGSPHDFDQFSLSKIGTGEGAQAYGHGLYFAENPAVTEQYRGLKEPPHQGNVQRSIAGAALDRAKNAGLSGDAAKREALRELNEMAASSTQDWRRQKIYDAINNFDAVVTPPKSGHTYEVNIHASPDELLDWDKPLSQQPPKVQEALVKSGVLPEGYDRLQQVTQQMDAIAGRPAAEHARHPEWTAQWDTLAAERRKLMEKFGDHPLSRQIQYGNVSGSDLYRNAGAATNAEAAEKLKQAGIKGIQYLDQGSRAAGEGTKNFVIFDDQIIEIAKKFGLSLPVAASLYKWQQSQQPKKGVE